MGCSFGAALHGVAVCNLSIPARGAVRANLTVTTAVQWARGEWALPAAAFSVLE